MKNIYPDQIPLRRVITSILEMARKLAIPFLCLLLVLSCEDFLEVELPKDRLSRETVFDDRATAESVLRGIYGKMRDEGLLGSAGGLNFLMGLYTDELDNYDLGSDAFVSFQTHNVLANDMLISSWWSDTYNQIYEANALIEGISNSNGLTGEVRDQFTGEALFIRGYLHLLLVELFGDVPYIKTSDFGENNKVARMPVSEVYENIILDLTTAIGLLPEDNTVNDGSTRPVRVFRTAAHAVLARAHLYVKDWEGAATVSTVVIDRFGALEPDLDQVFPKEGPGTIWQFKPESEGENTVEGENFIFETLTEVRRVALNEVLVGAFEPGDQRKDQWIRAVSDGTDTLYHAFKYKERFNSGTSVEHSIKLRLAEQYLIRAEALAEQGNIAGAQSDLNVVRNRAGLPNTTANTAETLLDAILRERQVELFTEGHRWFDLKRMGRAREFLEPIKPGWRDTDILLPLPEQELLVNTNLLPQNEGY